MCLGLALAVISVFSLWISLVGTVYDISIPTAAHLLIAKPYHDSFFSSRVQWEDKDMTAADVFVKSLQGQVNSGEAKPEVAFWLVVVVASISGRFELIDEWVSKYNLDDA